MVAKFFLLVTVTRHSKGQSEADKKRGLSFDYISMKEKKGHYQEGMANRTLYLQPFVSSSLNVYDRENYRSVE
jgi:hypothetical protein